MVAACATGSVVYGETYSSGKHDLERVIERAYVVLERSGNDDKPVTTYGVRKWLTGESIPSQDKLVVLAAWLGVSPEWLRYGPTNPTPATQLQQAVAVFEPDDLVFFRSYRKLTPEYRLAVREVVLTLLRVQSRDSK